MLLNSAACFEWNLVPSLNYIYINCHLLLGKNIPFPFFHKLQDKVCVGSFLDTTTSFIPFGMRSFSQPRTYLSMS